MIILSSLIVVIYFVLYTLIEIRFTLSKPSGFKQFDMCSLVFFSGIFLNIMLMWVWLDGMLQIGEPYSKIGCILLSNNDKARALKHYMRYLELVLIQTMLF